MTKPPRRGGLGRGLGALIPTGVPQQADDAAENEAAGGTTVMSGDPASGEEGTAASAQPAAASGSPGKGANRVPALSSLTASAATDFYFDPSPVPGTTLRYLRPDEITANPKQPRQVFDEESLEELSHSIKEFGVLQPIVVRPPGQRLRTGDGRAPAAGRHRGWPGPHPRHRAGHRRRGDAPGCVAGEHPPRPAEPAGRGGRLPAAAAGVRCHPRGAGQQDRPEPVAGRPTPSG